MKRTLYSILILLGLSLVACTTDDNVHLNHGLSDDYFPMELGHSLTYSLDSVYFSLEGNTIRKDSVQWLVKESIKDTSRAEDNRQLYHVHRKRFKEGSIDTIQDREWRLWVENGSIIKQVGNLPYIKMLRDIHLGSSWDPHAYFDAREVKISIKSNRISPYSIPFQAVATALESSTYNNVNIDSVLTIQLVDFDDNFIEKRYSIEKYAQHIGLVEKIEFIVNTQCRIRGGNPGDCEPLSWLEKAEEGYFMHKKILSWN